MGGSIDRARVRRFPEGPALEWGRKLSGATSKPIDSTMPFILMPNRMYNVSRCGPVLFVLSGMQIRLPDIGLVDTASHMSFKWWTIKILTLPV